MPYSTIKYSILFMLILSIFLVIRKLKSTHKVTLPTFICSLFLLICAVLLLFPIENLFITFTSPEQAYEFTYPQNTKVTVVEGAKSTLVMGVNKENEIEYQVFPKTKNGWKRLGLLQIQFYQFYPAAGISTTLVRYKPSGDCYAWVHSLRNQDCEITDELGSQFRSDEELTGDILHEYYAYVGQPSGTYTLTIDGVDYTLTGLP